MLDYNEAVQQMMDLFDQRDYQGVIEIYDEICREWPDPLERQGSIDNYAQYARARLAVEQHDYNSAILILSTLGNFPSADEPLNAARLQIYCEAQRFLTFHLYEEALKKFMACNGILDSARMVELLSSEEQETIYNFSAVCGSNSATLSWVDLEPDTDSYFITYMPKDVESGAKTEQSSNQLLVLTDLIPRTTYSAYLIPVKNGIASGLSAAIEFSTGTPQKSTGAKVKEFALFAYDRKSKEEYLRPFKEKSENIYLKAVIDKKKRSILKDSVWEVEEELALPISDMAFADTGYIVYFSWSQKINPGETIRAVIRSENGENKNLVYATDVPVFYKAGIADAGFYLDELLDAMYANQKGWPYDTDLIIEFYSGDTLLCQESYHLVAE